MATGSKEDQNRNVRLIENGKRQDTRWHIPVEEPVAITFNGLSHAVMMLTPSDLADFATGFAFTEGVVERASEVVDLKIRSGDQGTEIDIQIPDRRMEKLTTRNRRRVLVGRSGCGICGLDDLHELNIPIPEVQSDLRIAAEIIQKAGLAFSDHQPLNRLTRSVHGAAWVSPKGEIQLVREDIGRHNALDKLIGAMMRQNLKENEGFTLLSSRLGYELSFKAARAGIAVVVSISAPTSRALDIAEESGITTASFAPDGIAVFTHSNRITDGAA